MISGEQLSDYSRILAHTATCPVDVVHRDQTTQYSSRQFQREELAELLLDELFPRSFSLSSISQKLCQRQCENVLRTCSMTELIEELRTRLPELDLQMSKAGVSNNESRIGVLQDIVQQVVSTWKQDWEVSQMTEADSQEDDDDTEVKTASYLDGIEELSLSMIWLFILWLYRSIQFVYKEVIGLAVFKSASKAQLAAAIQGIVLLAATTWYCVTMLQSNCPPRLLFR